jgi:hypothetical protein
MSSNCGHEFCQKPQYLSGKTHIFGARSSDCLSTPPEGLRLKPGCWARRGCFCPGYAPSTPGLTHGLQAGEACSSGPRPRKPPSSRRSRVRSRQQSDQPRRPASPTSLADQPRRHSLAATNGPLPAPGASPCRKGILLALCPLRASCGLLGPSDGISGGHLLAATDPSRTQRGPSGLATCSSGLLPPTGSPGSLQPAGRT